MAKLFRLLKAMENIAIGGIAVTPADGVMRMITQKVFPYLVNPLHVDLNALITRQRNGGFELA